jgi:hypothetical protein
VYPLFAAMGVAVGICGFQLFRNITGNPEVRSGSPPLRVPALFACLLA